MFGSKPESVLRTAEAALLKSFDTITGMTRGNTAYMSEYYGIARSRFETLNVWTGKDSTTITKEEFGSAVVFGGQLVAGRNLGFAIDFLGGCRVNNPELTLTIHSWGEEYERLKEEYAGSEWILFEGKISRDAYVDRISEFDAGLIVTDPNVQISTFPSKIMDYFGSGLRCICFVEENNELDSVIEDGSVLFVNHFDSSDAEEKRLNRFLLSGSAKTRRAALSEHKVFKVDITAQKLLSIATCDE